MKFTITFLIYYMDNMCIKTIVNFNIASVSLFFLWKIGFLRGYTMGLNLDCLLRHYW